MKRQLLTLLLLIVLGLTVTGQDYPSVEITVEGDTLWTLTHRQYTNCLENSEDLIIANKIIDELNYQICLKDFLIEDLKESFNETEKLYYKKVVSNVRLTRQKKRWRAISLIEAGILAILIPLKL